MAYSKTWNNDSANYNAGTSRALNKIETQASGQWSVKVNNTWGNGGAAPHAWICTPTASRAFATLYKNAGTVPILVMASISTQGVNNATMDGSSAASIEVYDNGGVLLFEVGRQRCTAPTVALAKVEQMGQLFAVVNAGEQYKLNNLSGAAGVATVKDVFEFAFDANYVAQTWTHGEARTLSKFNTYAAGVNRISPKADAFTYGTSAAFAAFTDNDRVTLLTFNYTNSYSNIVNNSGGVKTIAQKNSGDAADVNIGEVGAHLTGAAEVGGGIYTAAALGNASGHFSTVDTFAGGTLNFRKLEFVAPTFTDILFVAAESGTATGDKFRNLDTRASNGSNMASAMTHTAVTVAHPTTTIASISTAWRIVTVDSTLSSSATTNSVVTISVDATSILTPTDNSANTVHPRMMSLFVLPAGSSATITESGNAANINAVHTWTVA